MASSTSLMLLASMMLTAAVSAQNTTYKPVEVWSGAGFFGNFDFFTQPDPTKGLVRYVDFDEANATSLVGTISGGPADGSAYLGVDFSNKSADGRKSVRLTSKKTFGQHLLVADIHHMPAVCGGWQALWAVGPEWPSNGEIDYIESVHDISANRMSLHTKESLVISNHTQYMEGVLEEDNCAVDANNVGCTVLDAPDSASSGSKFNDGNGGIFAAEFSSKGIQIWFFPRNTEPPADIKFGTPVPSGSWGKPAAMFMGQDVDWDRLFQRLTIVINTTFCGEWAGQVWPQSQCASLAPTCEDYVANHPEVFKDAYWAIKGITVYQQMLQT